MHYYIIVTTSHVNQRQSAFTYHSEQELRVGNVVLVSVGKKEIVGIVLEETSKPTFKTKPVIRSIEDRPIPLALIKLASWLSVYYQSHPANVWQTILPRGLQKKRRTTQKTASHPERERTNIVFNKDQAAAIESISTATAGTLLLEGVTGSGKTAVYIEAAKRTLAENKSTIVLVPEIALTSQLVAEFSHSFDDIILTHSTMTEADRHRAWLECLNSDKPRLVIGPRSALFSPLRDLGLIIIDECHEPSFKQEQAPRYSALRAGSVLAKYSGAKVVLGSATPAVVDRYLAETSESKILKMTKPARPGTVAPHISVIDMTQKMNFARHRFLSNTLLDTISSTLKSGKQSLLFHNRRGSAPTTLCENCGWSAMCQRCFIPLTLHTDSFQLRCHICDQKDRVPTSCPECGGADVIHKGIGTKLIESELRKYFRQAHIARFDGDSSDNETIEKRYQELYDGSIDIIIGTQVIAKGLDLPHLRTVGIIQADSGLSLPDFQSGERVFQLVSQVRGRIGRNKHTSNFIVQSYNPSHPSIVFGITQDYESFYKATTAERRRGVFPPYTHLLKLTCVYKTEAGAIRACRALAQDLRSKKHSDVTILGPAPAFYERVRDTYRWQLTIKSPKREHLIQLLSHIPPAKWQIDLDPISLL